MAKGNGRWGAMTRALGSPERATTRRWVYIWLALVALGWFWILPRYVSAQDKKEDAKPAETQAPAAAPAAAPADTGPKGDPAGTNTGDESTAIDSGGTAFPNTRSS
jgi:hypothetical protein